MADKTTSSEMQPTLGLTGLTMNAMALIAPGAFLWLTFVIQGATGNTAPSMWIGICFCATSLSGHCGLLCGAGEAVSRTGQFILLCRTVISESSRKCGTWRGFPSSSSDGARTFITGFIRA